MRFGAFRKPQVMSHKKGGCVNVLDEDTEDGRTIALQSLSNTQLIQILQHHDGDDDLTQMVEEELARRKTEGTPQ
jgi:streptomycin 6-kinase